MTTYEVESKQILQTLQYMIDGVTKLDQEQVLRAFHPRGRVYNTGGDCVEGVPINIYCKRILKSLEQKGVNPFAEGEPDNDVVYINIAGDAASVKMEWRFPEVKLVEYYTLLKLAGSWLIVCKAWSKEEKR